MGNGKSWGLSFLTKFFRKKVHNKPAMAHLHAAACGGEYNAGVFCTYGEKPAYNLNLVSSIRAEVQVTKGMLSFAESPQRMK